MRVIQAKEIADLLAWPALIERLRRTFQEGVESPGRHHHAMHRPDGEATMLLMPAWESAGYIGVKVVNVFPQNSAHRLPAISGVYLLCEGQHGTPLACIDGSELTRRRTAAASALAASMLARKNADTLLVVGTGQLAPMLIEAHSRVRPIKRVLVWGRERGEAVKLASHYADHFETAAVDDLRSASGQADIISCATLSTEVLIQGDWLRPGTHLDLVGAFRPDMRECDANALARAEVFVDTYAGAQGEAGDILQAIQEKAFRFSDIQADLFELVRGEKPGRSSDTAVTLFKSVGASLEDLAAAIEVWEQHRLRNPGQA
ncbi:ornithine cyclodeaminase family protein [Marinobacterium rhizophilum]|uniref:Ornithine cyclodeaminase family protein n=1 Tax=Marinobacterium rhizophilum TaxID=420402 RepID=A0ABY5HSV2_9GAMM|nr:ornithine cyclodeaminase family protein [Marinobacterium rhizophilum]UTW14269.1 ornithine cyclodeaminase family protein [Marinobacterium rhizophilum]